jgi:hypothetical protein
MGMAAKMHKKRKKIYVGEFCDFCAFLRLATRFGICVHLCLSVVE